MDCGYSVSYTPRPRLSTPTVEELVHGDVRLREDIIINCVAHVFYIHTYPVFLDVVLLEYVAIGKGRSSVYSKTPNFWSIW